MGIRSADLGYGDDAIRQKFGTYERDNESGLDYAQARYFSSPQGRFTSPDPLLASGIEDEPQSWNRYAYCINNPLKFTDPTGMIWGFLQTNVGDRYVWYKDEQERKAAGATPITANDVYGKAFIYEAAGGAWIRLDLSQNSWQLYEKEYQAYFGREHDGSSSLSDMGLTLNLFMAGQGGLSLTTNLARGAFLRATTTEVFRVEALAGANTTAVFT